MSIVQFMRIIWARRLMILVATVCCCIGAAIVVLVLPPRWDAHTRVMMNVSKPDPVTGQAMNVQDSRIYAATQIEMITDPTVASQVAEQMGWLSDPQLIAAYQRRSSADQRDFRSWLAQIIIDNTKAKILDNDSNIIEITYSGDSASHAKAVADILRKVYIEDSVFQRRQTAEKNAEFYEQQAIKSKAALDAAIGAETTYERQNGLVMANDKIDIDSARLQALSATPAAQMAAPPVLSQANPQAEMELGQVDAQISATAKVLGPNNPDLLALKTRRAALAATVAQERATTKAMTSTGAANATAFERAVQAQKAKVIANSDKIGRLTQLQNEVNLHREELARIQERIAMYRQETLAADAGLSPVGVASTPKAATFPNYLLIVPGALLGGLLLGTLLAILMELLGRRVRGVEDLTSLEDLPLIGVVGAPEGEKKRPLWRLGSRGQANRRFRGVRNTVAPA